MQMLRVLAINLGVPALLPLLLLGACSSDEGDGANGGTGGAGVSGTGAAGSTQAGAGGSAAGATGQAGIAGTANTAGSAGTSGAPAGGSSANGGSAGASPGGRAGSASGAGGASGGSTPGGAAGASGGTPSGGASGAPSGGTGGGGAFALSTTAFENKAGCSKTDKQSCGTFPTENTNYGSGMMKNVSPPLAWTNVPAGTQSFAVVFQDLSNGMAHWVLWNIPAATMSLPAGVPTGAMPAMPAGSRQVSISQNGGYFGPGAPCNVYEFIVYALSQPMISPPMPTQLSGVRTYVQGLGTGILGQAAIRARSDEGACQ
jgi:Raf kinase inhibitor-like YbhB/YbcL family protein